MDVSKLAERLRELSGQRLIFYRKNQPVSLSYTEVYADVQAAVSGLESYGIEPGMHVGLLAENCYEWIVYDLALLQLNCITVCFPPEEFSNVPLESLGEKYALNLLLISEKERKRRQDSTGWVISLERDDDRSAVVRRFDEQQREMKDDRFPLDPTVMTLAFSSGTSGTLKCLMISKRGTEEWLKSFGYHYSFKPDDRMLVVLPLSNFQQRLMIYTAICYGFNLILTDPLGMFRALKEMQPTILIGPPMFYEVLENRFRSLPFWRQQSLLAIGRLISLVPARDYRGKLRRWLFEPFHSAFGSNVRLMLTGMAPCKGSTLRLFDLLGLPLFQVYGLTETGLVAWNLPGRNRIGSVGKTVSEGSVTIAADGEIIVRYEHPLACGYLHCSEDEERRTFLDDKRIATGDIGKFDKDGYLYIMGRKKEIIITQGGYKIQPEPLEAAIEELPEVSRGVILGGDGLPYLIAVVSLRAQSTPEVEKNIRRVVAKLNKESHSSSQIGQVIFTDTQFNIANGFLTRNLKVDRRAVYQSFKGSLLRTA
jgi:long-chain acyl-CoA synthetase